MNAEQSHTPQLDNFTLRIVTALVLIPFALFITHLGGVFMLAVMLMVTLIGTLEFYHMEKQRYQGANTWLGFVVAVLVVLAFYFQQSWLWAGALLMGALLTFVVEYVRSRNVWQSAFRIITTLGGVLYLALPAGCLLVIRAMNPDGLWWVYAVYLATWGTDSIAYFVGRQIGRTPLAPKLSPKKTREGAVGGWLGGWLIPSLFLLAMNLYSVGVFVLLCLAPLVAIWGDLFESALKRFFDLKDSGIRGLNLFPGHGGVLDRIDALVWVTLIFYAYLWLNGRVGF
jgi:phosphatidate cytidylyltransferase